MSTKTFNFEIDGKRFRVSLKKDQNGRYLAQYTDLSSNKTNTRILDIKRLSYSTSNIILNGKSLTITIAHKENVYEVELYGKHLKIIHLDKQRAGVLDRARQGGVASGEEAQILAPMPGKIIQVLKDVGQEVQPGEGLVILEAMKMENEMRSEHRGKISEILVKPGQKVETGEKILKITCQ